MAHTVSRKQKEEHLHINIAYKRPSYFWTQKWHISPPSERARRLVRHSHNNKKSRVIQSNKSRIAHTAINKRGQTCKKKKKEEAFVCKEGVLCPGRISQQPQNTHAKHTGAQTRTHKRGRAVRVRCKFPGVLLL